MFLITNRCEGMRAESRDMSLRHIAHTAGGRLSIRAVRDTGEKCDLRTSRGYRTLCGMDESL